MSGFVRFSGRWCNLPQPVRTFAIAKVAGLGVLPSPARRRQLANGWRPRPFVAEGMAETVRLCEAAGLPQGLRVTTHIADVSDFAQMERFRAEVADRHATDRIHLLFNNAGIGGGSLIASSCEEWERTFNVCWGSVYNGTRAFLPLLLKAEEGHIVNTKQRFAGWYTAVIGAPRSCRQYLYG